MIVEGICTTLNGDRSVNIAPMGPVTDENLSSLLFRPFQSSRTFENLSTRGCGVFHIIDDVELIARGAIGQIDQQPETFPASVVTGQVLANACRWIEFEVDSIDAGSDRSEITTRIVHRGELRPFFGFNRARHAVLEAAILATRLHLLPRAEIDKSLQQLEIIVDKTAGEQERRAMQLLTEFIAKTPTARDNPDGNPV